MNCVIKGLVDFLLWGLFQKRKKKHLINDKKPTFDKFKCISLLQYAAQNVENNNYFLIISNLQ